MTIMLFVAALTVFLFSSFTLSFRLQTINRVVMYTPVELFETAIPIVEKETRGLYFSKEKLRSNLQNYYDKNLSNVLEDYTMSLYFYNQGDGSICTKTTCDAVEVTVEGRCFLTFNYSRTVSYEIHKGAKNGE